MTAQVISVNVATPAPAEWATPLRRTAIRKRPVEGPVLATELGLEGDQVADTRHHGGVHQAVYAFAREDLDVWADRLQRPIPDGQFGENLTTGGIDVNEARIGERWAVGTAVLEVAEVRIPCNVFKGWMGESGFDNTAWVKRFTAEARPGPYLRVVVPGQLRAGDPVRVVHRPAHDITVTLMFLAFTTESHLLPRLLEAGDALTPKARRAAQKHAARS